MVNFVSGLITGVFVGCAYIYGRKKGKASKQDVDISSRLSALETKVDKLLEEDEPDNLVVNEYDYELMTLQQAFDSEKPASVKVQINEYMLTTHSYAGTMSDKSRIDMLFDFFMSRDLYSDDEAKTPLLLEQSKVRGLMDLRVFGEYDKETKVFSIDKISGRIMDEPYEVPTSSLYQEDNQKAPAPILDE